MIQIGAGHWIQTSQLQMISHFKLYVEFGYWWHFNPFYASIAIISPLEGKLQIIALKGKFNTFLFLLPSVTHCMTQDLNFRSCS